MQHPLKIFKIQTYEGSVEKGKEKMLRTLGVGKYSITFTHPAAALRNPKNSSNFERPGGEVGVEIRQNLQNFNTHLTAASLPGNEGDFQF